MKGLEQLFDRGWVAVGGELWESQSTYRTVPYAFLPDVRNRATNDLRWLESASPALKEAIDESCTLAFENKISATQIGALVTEVHERKLRLPEAFLRFIRDPKLQRMVPTCTGCYLELSEALVALPELPGRYLLRFMNDSQCCVLWYLCLSADADACVLTSPYFFEPDLFAELHEEVTRDELLHETRLCADSFVEFLYRFWIEDTIWFARNDDLPFTAEQQDYWNRARQ